MPGATQKPESWSSPLGRAYLAGARIRPLVGTPVPEVTLLNGRRADLFAIGRKGDRSPELALILKLIRQMYRKEGIVFGT